MKHIEKRPPIPDFVDFVQNEHPTSWEDIHHSKRHPNLYHDCREAILLNEQYGIGGYTERPLKNASDLHIDHYRKKGMNWPQDVTFDWNNFVVESRNPNFGACHKDNNTSVMADYDRLLNPMVDYPESMFTYLPNGEITACDGLDEKSEDKVNFTIDRFNLNHKSLRLERETLIKIISYYNMLSDEDIRDALKDYGYPTVVEYALMLRQRI